MTETTGTGIGHHRVQLTVCLGDLGEQLRKCLEIRQISRDHLEAGSGQGPVREIPPDADDPAPRVQQLETQRPADATAGARNQD